MKTLNAVTAAKVADALRRMQATREWNNEWCAEYFGCGVSTWLSWKAEMHIPGPWYWTKAKSFGVDLWQLVPKEEWPKGAAEVQR